MSHLTSPPSRPDFRHLVAPSLTTMQSPSHEIHAVIELINSAITPDVQKASVNKFFTSDAGLHTPWYVVNPGSLSRESILGIYQWYRTISPTIDVDIRDIVYDRLHNIVYVDLAVLYHLRFSPFAPTLCRMMSRFTLRQELGFHYIAMQEDFLHPDDIASVYMSYLGPLVRMALSASALSSNIWASCAQMFDIWRASPGLDHVHVEEVVTKPYKQRVGAGRLRHKVKREVSRSIKRSQQLAELDEFSDGCDAGALSKSKGAMVDRRYNGGEDYQSSVDAESPAKSGATRFGGLPARSRFAETYEGGSPGKLVNHVTTRGSGRNPYGEVEAAGA